MQEKIFTEQKRSSSAIWWAGMAAAAAQGICAVAIASGAITAEVGAAITAGFAGVFAYCNGNNPSIKGSY